MIALRYRCGAAAQGGGYAALLRVLTPGNNPSVIHVHCLLLSVGRCMTSPSPSSLTVLRFIRFSFLARFVFIFSQIIGFHSKNYIKRAKKEKIVARYSFKQLNSATIDLIINVIDRLK